MVDKVIQYPIWASIDPTTLSEPLRDEIQWFQEFSIPVRRLISIANIPSFFIDTETLGEVGELTITDEFQKLSEPIRLTKVQQPNYPITSPELHIEEAITDLTVHTTDTLIIDRRIIIVQTIAPIDPLSLEEIFDEGLDWAQEFSLPVRRAVSVADIISTFIDPLALDEPSITTDEFQPFSEPTIRVKTQQPDYLIIDPETFGEQQIDELEWMQNLSTPTIPRVRYQFTEMQYNELISIVVEIAKRQESMMAGL